MLLFKLGVTFINFVQLDIFLLTPFKSLTAMNIDCHMSLRSFFFLMSTCQPNSVPYVKVNVINSIWSLYLLFLFNLVPILFKIDQFCLYRRCDQI